MKPEKALELVGRYARLTHSIAACKKRIAAELDKCPGQAGRRLGTYTDLTDVEVFGVVDASDETHLAAWYAKDYGEPGEFGFERFTVGEGDEATDCPHCFAAHLIVQERKALRKQLSTVKGSMTRSVPAGEGV
jgi:hypothetical protein